MLLVFVIIFVKKEAKFLLVFVKIFVKKGKVFISFFHIFCQKKAKFLLVFFLSDILSKKRLSFLRFVLILSDPNFFRFCQLYFLLSEVKSKFKVTFSYK